MKKIILIIILSLAVNNSLIADICELPPGCEDKEFPYTFCNSNNLLTRCSKNPYDEYDGNTQLEPMKLDGCFNYVSSSYHISYKTVEHHDIVVTQHYESIGTDPEGYDIFGYYDDDVPIYYPGTEDEIRGFSDGDYIYEEYDTRTDNVTYTDEPCNEVFTDFWGNTAFDYNAVQSDIVNALNTWKNICNGCTPNDQYLQHCCVPVSWTQTAREFYDRGWDAHTTLAYTSRTMLPGSMNPCDYDCDKLYIHINQSNDFTGATETDPCDYSNNFFVTGSTSKGHWYSLTATLMHEMGHIFGFEDQAYGEGTACPHDKSIMMDTDFDDTDRGLSDDDICMYMKMYCWTPPTGVEEIKETDMAVRIFPNPTNNDLINIQFVNPIGLLMAYEIISPLGISILKGDIQPNENPKTVTLDNLSSGVYFLILKHEFKQEMLKFVINK